MSQSLQRGLVFIQQNRPELAEKELRRAVAEDPDNAMALTFLAQCLCDMGREPEAEAAARQAVGRDPDSVTAHFMLGRSLLGQQKLKEAREEAEQALRLEPDEAANHGLLAGVLLSAQRWDEALAAAERGLALDPEAVWCANLRATALTKLGRSAEAKDAIDQALRKRPLDSDTHANRGWVLLHQGKTKEALEHFREALRQNPNNDYAKAGLVEGLKSRIFIYRWLLSYFLWMSTLSTGARYGVLIGGYFGYQVLRSISRNNEALSPYITPIIWLYIAFALMTWIGPALFNLMLFLNPYGRYALSRAQRHGSIAVGLLLLGAIVSSALVLATGFGPWIPLAVFFASMMLPVSSMFGHRHDPRHRLRLGLVLGLAAIGLIAVSAAFLGEAEVYNRFETLYLFAFIGYTWVAAFSSATRPAS